MYTLDSTRWDVHGDVHDTREAEVDNATAEETGVVTPEPAVLQERARTLTDARFEADRPGYYIFGKDAVERECWACGKPYKTRMELNKFCGPKCKNSWLEGAFGKLKV